MVACRALGAKRSALSPEQTTSEIPNQPASLTMVPRFPGSWMPSRHSTRSVPGEISSGEYSGRRQSARQGGAVFRKVALASSSGEASSTLWAFPAIGASCLSHPGVAARNSTSHPEASKAVTSFVPSATKSFSFSLYFLCSSDLMILILFFPSIVLYFFKDKPKNGEPARNRSLFL